MLRTCVLGTCLATMFVVAPVTTSLAAGGAQQGDVCVDPTPAKYLPANDGVAPVRLSADEVNATARYKAQHDTPAEAAAARSRGAADAAMVAQKEAMFRSGKLKPLRPVTVLSSRAALEQACGLTQGPAGAASKIGQALGGVVPQVSAWSGPGYSWITGMNQQGQWYPNYCGPATISEIAITVPGPSYVTQGTAASYVGISPYSGGTSVNAMTNALNKYVGVPDVGWNFYTFVFMDDNPTQTQRDAFFGHMSADTSSNWPVAGDAYEVTGGPHLLGHPNGNFFHWFEIGGYGSYGASLYYADSATTVWSSVQAYNWEDTYTVETIMGGRGYDW